jgi:cytochrome c biogenesis protein CcmG/thiol:disulfide interchange protein DsbE
MTCPGRYIATFAIIIGSMIAAAATARPPVVGEPAPSFEVTYFDGTKVSLADLRGEVVILNFWATWCAPCREELPLLDGYSKLRQDAGLRVVAVTTEDSVPPYKLKPLAARLTMKLARRMHGNYAPLAGVPTNYVIDRAGVLRYAEAGAFDLDSLNELLVPLLNQKTPPATSVAAK